ncbi:sulfatase-like hydrolase/transferase [Shigella flexneri]
MQRNTQQKKLIVLHLNGSHEPACSACPQSSAVFNRRTIRMPADDNSIHYTDSLLGQVFELLKDRRASVMYFADHRIERDPTKKNVYFHGGREASQQAYQSRCLSGIASFLGMAWIVRRKTTSFRQLTIITLLMRGWG